MVININKGNISKSSIKNIILNNNNSNINLTTNIINNNYRKQKK